MVSHLRLSDLDHEFDGTDSQDILRFLQGFPKLQSLCIGDMKISDGGPSVKVLAALKHLKEFKVEPSNFNTVATELINGIVCANSAALQSVDIGYNVNIRVPKNWNNLKKLVVSDQALQTHWMFVNAPRLESLWVRYHTGESETIYLTIIIAAIRKWKDSLCRSRLR